MGIEIIGIVIKVLFSGVLFMLGGLLIYQLCFQRYSSTFELKAEADSGHVQSTTSFYFKLCQEGSAKGVTLYLNGDTADEEQRCLVTTGSFTSAAEVPSPLWTKLESARDVRPYTHGDRQLLIGLVWDEVAHALRNYGSYATLPPSLKGMIRFLKTQMIAYEAYELIDTVCRHLTVPEPASRSADWNAVIIKADFLMAVSRLVYSSPIPPGECPAAYFMSPRTNAELTEVVDTCFPRGLVASRSR